MNPFVEAMVAGVMEDAAADILEMRALLAEFQTALGRLRMEAAHYEQHGIGAEFLRSAVAHADTVLLRANAAVERMSR